MRVISTILGVILLFGSLSLTAQQTAPVSVMELYQHALKAKKEQKYPEYLRFSQQLFNISPGHPGIRFLLSEAQVLNGDLQTAKTNLLRAAQAGISLGPDRLTEFQKIQDSEEYKKALELFDKNKQNIGQSEIAFKIPQKDLIAEGVAYDPVSKSLFVSSTYRRKIVEIDASGVSKDFIIDKQDGIWGVVGMEVDSKRRHLWANSGNLDQNMVMKYPEPETLGFTAVHKYDLGSKKLIKKYVLAVKGEKHFFNDLSVSTAGDVYITDTDEGSVYRILASKDELEPFVKPGRVTYANGIALSGDEKHLYIAHLEGISVVNLKTLEMKLVTTPENIATTGIDGMVFYENSLIANQGLTGSERITRFYLSDPARISKVEVLQQNHPAFMLPTTGVVAENSFYYIANSQLRSFDETGKIWPASKLQETIILKVPI